MTPKEIIQSADIVAVVTSYGVEVKKLNSEYVARCQYHDDDKPSMTIVPARSGNKGFVHCFACGAHDDAAGFVAHMEGCSFLDAVKKLNGGKIAAKPSLITSLPKAECAPWIAKRPETDEPPDMFLADFGNPVQVFTYRDTDGWPIMYMAEYERKSEMLLHRCWSWGGLGITEPPQWAARLPNPIKMPVYNQHHLAANPSAQVLITESEAAADMAMTISPGHVAVSWPMGAWWVRYVDFSPLAGRRCVLIPDNDAVSRDCMRLLAAILYHVGAAEVRGIDSQTDDEGGREVDFPPGWSLAHAVGWDAERFRAWARRRALIYPKPRQRQNQPETLTVNEG